MVLKKAYKFRIYPNKTQASLINQTFGCSRFLYNRALYEVKNNKKNFHKGTAMKEIPQLKKAFPWLKVVDSIALQVAIEDLADGFDRFFKKQTKLPTFKSKRKPVKSYTTKMVNNNIQLQDNKVKLPKLGWMRYANSKQVEGVIKRATIRQSASGKYFVSILFEIENTYQRTSTNKSTGIDLGLTDFLVLSDGSKIKNPRHLKQLEGKLAKAQRILSRRVFGSSNWHKQKIKIARIHEKIANVRNDFLHKLSRNIVEAYDIIGIENLNVSNMLQNKRLAKSISDASWSMFVSMLTYKATWYGATLLSVGKHFASSQTCSGCGHESEKVKDLSVRIWTCTNCNTSHDRDINAATNVKTEALRLLTTQTTVGTTGIA